MKNEKTYEEILESLTNNRQINRYVMNHTYHLCDSDLELKNAINCSIANEKIIYENDNIFANVTKKKNPTVIVSKDRSLEAASKYKGKKVVVLNFANNHSVGGAPWYAGAQEESMCRISTLYPCIKAKYNEFYKKHKDEFDSGVIDEFGSNDLIYTPDIVVFKTDEGKPKLLDNFARYKVDMITCAAPDLDYGYDQERFKNVINQRIKRILDIAYLNNAEVLILGAFGCGAFHNPPEIVAEAFKNNIYNYNFETVEFAVFCRDGNETNYNIFKNVIENK